MFGCWWRPIAVILIIPLGAVGAILGHYCLGFSLTIVSLVGLLGLAGILVNDSIILVPALMGIGGDIGAVIRALLGRQAPPRTAGGAASPN